MCILDVLYMKSQKGPNIDKCTKKIQHLALKKRKPIKCSQDVILHNVCDYYCSQYCCKCKLLSVESVLVCCKDRVNKNTQR